MKVYVVTYAIEHEGIQDVLAVLGTEELAKAHVEQLRADAYSNEFYKYEEFTVRTATTGNAEPATGSANE